MANDYEIVFSVPATVQFTVRVSGENQQEAIVCAFDQVHQQPKSAAVVVAVDMPAAEYIGMQMVPVHEQQIQSTSLSSELPISDNSGKAAFNRYRVNVYSKIGNPKMLVPDLVINITGGQAAAEAAAEETLRTHLQYLYAQVISPANICVVKKFTKRFGFEIRWQDPNSGEELFKTGISNKIAAFSAANSLKQDGLAVAEHGFKIIQYNDENRKEAPKEIATIY